MSAEVETSDAEKRDEGVGKIVSIKTVAGVYFGGLLLALLITWGFGGFKPGMIMGIHLFPLGLLYFIPEGEWGEWGVWLWNPYSAYAVYAAIFIAAFIWRKKSIFIAILVIYIIILCINISGCAVLLNTDFHSACV